MIKFFRKIRQNLLTENKFSKYLLYAIGEIILVVIGILIALQINNWNEENKVNQFEIIMLKEIQNALTDDITNFQNMSKRMSILKENANAFVSLIANGNSYSDSLANKMFGLNIGISTQYNRGPYDAIKASGIDKIANDSLRNKLIYFYDFLYPRFISNTEHYNRNYTNDIDQIIQLQQNPVIKKVADNAIIVQEFKPDAFERPEFLKTLRSIQFRSNGIYNRLNDFIPEMKKLIKDIEIEIVKTKG